jgi:uncharacterized protein
MGSIDWVVKASKLCNLRCRYCYEWENLADPARMSLDTWRSLVHVALQFHANGSAQSLPDPFVTRFVWRGGEPLLLPREYFDAVLEIQRHAFGADAFERGLVRNSAQTNLYAPDFALIEHLRDQGFTFGVSHDFVPGLRLTLSGNDSHERVMRNIQHLDTLGIKTGLIVVLAGHTVPHAESIYKEAREMGRRIRFLPLADDTGAPDMSHNACSVSAMVDALANVFRIWFDDGCPIPVDPLDECLRIVAMKWLGLEQLEYDREMGLDSVLVVEPDGAIRQICEPSDECDVLGNVRHQTWQEIRASAGYRASLERDRRVRSLACYGCRYRDVCDGYPVLRFNVTAAGRGECGVFKPLLARIEGELRELGVGPVEMRASLDEYASA